MPGPLSCTPTLKRSVAGRFDVDPDLRQDAGLFAGVERVVDRFLDRGEQRLARVVEAQQVAVLGEELADRDVALLGGHRLGGGAARGAAVPLGACASPLVDGVVVRRPRPRRRRLRRPSTCRRPATRRLRRLRLAASRLRRGPASVQTVLRVATATAPACRLGDDVRPVAERGCRSSRSSEAACHDGKTPLDSRRVKSVTIRADYTGRRGRSPTRLCAPTTGTSRVQSLRQANKNSSAQPGRSDTMNMTLDAHSRSRTVAEPRRTTHRPPLRTGRFSDQSAPGTRPAPAPRCDDADPAAPRAASSA